MDVISSPSKARKASPGPGRSRKGRNICLAVLGVIVAVIILIVILAFTVFKAKRPVTTVNSVSLADMDVSLNVPKLSVNLNVTLDANISVKNPNKVGFKYSKSSALLNYRGQVVGEAPIPAGQISADETMTLNLTLTVMADRLLQNSELYSDVISGTVPLNTYTRISGKTFGVEIPPRAEDSVPFFTPPQTQPVVPHASAYDDAAIQASLQSDVSGLSFPEIQTAQGLADVLMEMLGALDPKHPEEWHRRANVVRVLKD